MLLTKAAENKSNDYAGLNARVELLEKFRDDVLIWQNDTNKTLSKICDDTDEILKAVKGATVVGHFVKKHGPRVFAFGMGVLVAMGYLSPETAKNLVMLFVS